LLSFDSNSSILEYNRLLSKNDDTKSKVNSLTTTIEELESKLNNALKEASKSSGFENQIEKLKSENISIKNELRNKDSVEEEARNLKVKISQLEQQLSSKMQNTEIAESLKQNLNLLRAEKEKLLGDLANEQRLSTEWTHRYNILEEKHQETVQAYNAEKNSFEKQIADAKKNY